MIKATTIMLIAGIMVIAPLQIGPADAEIGVHREHSVLCTDPYKYFPKAWADQLYSDYPDWSLRFYKCLETLQSLPTLQY